MKDNFDILKVYGSAQRSDGVVQEETVMYML